MSTPTGPTPVTQSVVISGTVTDLADVPIVGAAAREIRGIRPSTVTDDSGRFALGPFELYPSDSLTVEVTKPGYLGTLARRLANSAEVVMNIRLPPLFKLPVDDSMTSQLLPTDPSTYVGADYDSDYSWNTKYFSFTTSATDDLVVELDWDRTGNAAPMMWALEGTIVSQPSGARQVLRLPHGASGVLLVGQPYTAGTLSQSASFTLTTRTGPPEDP